MADHIRVYFVVDAGAPRTDEQWALLVTGAKDKPLSSDILSAAQNTRFPQNLINFNRPSVPDDKGKYQWRLGDFEVDKSQVDDLLIELGIQATAKEVTGSNQAKFAGVMLKELQEVAVEAGYEALAPLLAFEIIGFGPRDTAIEQAQMWVAAHAKDWEPADGGVQALTVK